jgi:hypothetical protein
MIFRDRSASNICFRCLCVAIALIALWLPPQAKADTFDGPTFRKGMWHFVRTLELVLHQKNRHRLLEQEMTRCVDPTQAMRATFSSSSIGSCVSAKPRRSDNKYTFSNRCDFMGPVSTVITVHSDESYTEVNERIVGQHPKTESVVARRVGDCRDDAPGGLSVLSH